MTEEERTARIRELQAELNELRAEAKVKKVKRQIISDEQIEVYSKDLGIYKGFKSVSGLFCKKNAVLDILNKCSSHIRRNLFPEMLRKEKHGEGNIKPCHLGDMSNDQYAEYCAYMEVILDVLAGWERSWNADTSE